MKNIRVKLVQAHQEQNRNFDVKKELSSVQRYIDGLELELKAKGVCVIILKGYYDNFSKKMTTAVLFVNNTGKAIKELHGILRIKAENSNAKIAKTTINFDETFMGIVDSCEAILVHFNIPLKGENKDREFSGQELYGDFSEVRVTYVEE